MELTEAHYEKMGTHMRSIFLAQSGLRGIGAGRRWSNIVGDYGEVLAARKYDLTLLPNGAADADAIRNSDQKHVQIKTSYSSNAIGFRGAAMYLLLSKLESDCSIRQIYYGLLEPVFKAARYSERDNKYIITIAKLCELAKTVPQQREFNSKNLVVGLATL